jgi:hypothetical protein
VESRGKLWRHLEYKGLVLHTPENGSPLTTTIIKDAAARCREARELRILASRHHSNEIISLSDKLPIDLANIFDASQQGPKAALFYRDLPEFRIEKKIGHKPVSAITLRELAAEFRKNYGHVHEDFHLLQNTYGVSCHRSNESVHFTQSDLGIELSCQASENALKEAIPQVRRLIDHAVEVRLDRVRLLSTKGYIVNEDNNKFTITHPRDKGCATPTVILIPRSSRIISLRDLELIKQLEAREFESTESGRLIDPHKPNQAEAPKDTKLEATTPPQGVSCKTEKVEHLGSPNFGLGAGNQQSGGDQEKNDVHLHSPEHKRGSVMSFNDSTPYEKSWRAVLIDLRNARRMTEHDLHEEMKRVADELVLNGDVIADWQEFRGYIRTDKIFSVTSKLLIDDSKREELSGEGVRDNVRERFDTLYKVAKCSFGKPDNTPDIMAQIEEWKELFKKLRRWADYSEGQLATAISALAVSMPTEDLNKLDYRFIGRAQAGDVTPSPGWFEISVAALDRVEPVPEEIRNQYLEDAFKLASLECQTDAAGGSEEETKHVPHPQASQTVRDLRQCFLDLFDGQKIPEIEKMVKRIRPENTLAQCDYTNLFSVKGANSAKGANYAYAIGSDKLTQLQDVFAAVLTEIGKENKIPALKEKLDELAIEIRRLKSLRPRRAAKGPKPIIHTA